MLTFQFDSDELARTRFAFSALHETIASLRVVADPAAHPMHLPWLREAAPGLARLDLALLRSLVPADGYLPDFIMPPPDSPFPDLDVELDRMVATPADRVRDELATTFPDGLPAIVHPLADDPPKVLGQLRRQLESYFAGTLVHRWPEIRVS